MKWRRIVGHRHRFIIARPGVVRDPLTGLLYPFPRLFCRCGMEDPYGARMRATMEGR